MSKAFIETEALPETIERHQESFRRGDGYFALVIASDGSGFRVTMGDGETLNEQISSAEMLMEIMAVYGLDALKRIQ